MYNICYCYVMWLMLIIIIIDNFCISLFSGVHELSVQPRFNFSDGIIK